MSKATPHESQDKPGVVADALGDAALRQASSDAIFQRGKTYASSGAVEVLGEYADPTPAIHARVTGTEPYSTEVWIEDGEVGGDCDCPNAQDGWFCKHQVAVALVWRDRLAGQPTAIDEAARKKVQASAKRARTIKDRRQALRDFLHGLQAPALADKLLEMADQYQEITRELQQWRKLSQAQHQPTDLKRLVTEILSPGQGFLSWNESGRYVQRAEAVLPLLKQARERDPAGAAALVLHAMRRGWATLSQADDSNGDIGGLCQAIGAEWVAALQSAGAQPASFGDTYLRVQLDDPFGCFDAPAAEAAMGDAALARYRRALAERWRQAKEAVLAHKAERAAKRSARKGPSVPHFATDDAEPRLWTLERLHLQQLDRAGDVDGALAVLREDLSDPLAWGRVTRFLEAHGRLREAFTNAEQACKAFPDDLRLQGDLLRCYERDGWTTEALALRRRQFDQGPSVERYHQVLRAGVAAGRNAKQLRDELMQALEAREVEHLSRRPLAAPLALRPRQSPRPARDVSLRAEVLCSEKRWTQACELVQPPAACRDDVLQHIATHLDAAHREQALELLLRVFANAMRQSSSPYRRELALVDEIAGRLDSTRRAEWLAQLRVEHKSKRNFVRDLPQG